MACSILLTEVGALPPQFLDAWTRMLSTLLWGRGCRQHTVPVVHELLCSCMAGLG